VRFRAPLHRGLCFTAVIAEFETHQPVGFNLSLFSPAAQHPVLPSASATAQNSSGVSMSPGSSVKRAKLVNHHLGRFVLMVTAPRRACGRSSSSTSSVISAPYRR
jgi:hypothetical protein